MQRNLFLLGPQPNTEACFQERNSASGIYPDQERTKSNLSSYLLQESKMSSIAAVAGCFLAS